MKEAQELLTKLTKYFQPAENCKHNLTLDVAGNTVVTLMLPDEQFKFKPVSVTLSNKQLEQDSALTALDIIESFE